MNLALSDEQEFAARGGPDALSRHKQIEAARDALEDPDALPDLWPIAVEAGWPGLPDREDRGGAGLGVFDAMLVAEGPAGCWRRCRCLGLVPATAILDAAGDESLDAVAKASSVPCTSRHDRRASSKRLDGRAGLRGERAEAPRAEVDGDEVVLDGTVSFVPDAPGADLFVVVAEAEDGALVAAAVPGTPTACRSNR